MDLKEKSLKEQFQYLQDNIDEWKDVFPKLDEVLQIKLLKKNADLFYSLDAEVLSEEVVLAALQENGNLIAFVPKPNEKMIETALQNHPKSIRFLIQHGECEYESETCPVTIKKEWWEMVLQKDGETIQFHPDPSEKEWEMALESKPESIRFHKNPSEEVIWGVLEKRADVVYALEKIEIEDKPKYFRFALRKKPEVIVYIKEANPEYDWIVSETKDLSEFWSYAYKSSLLWKIQKEKRKVVIEDVQKEIHYIENERRLEILLKGLVGVECESGMLPIIENIVDNEEKKKVFEKYRLQLLI